MMVVPITCDLLVAFKVVRFTTLFYIMFVLEIFHTIACTKDSCTIGCTTDPCTIVDSIHKFQEVVTELHFLYTNLYHWFCRP